MEEPEGTVSDRPTAPGLKWRRRKNGDEVPTWVASDEARKAGYPVKTVNLKSTPPELLIGRCERLQSEMLMWLSGRRRDEGVYDGTFRSILDLYQSDPDSSYNTTLKTSTLRPYNVYLRLLREHIGECLIDESDGRDLKRWFDQWAARDQFGNPNHLPRGKMVLAVLKAAVSFGVACRRAGCAEFYTIMSHMSFPTPKERTEAPTAADVIKVRQAAHAAGHPGRALAYALQFETTLRQWDVIGQWVELRDRRPSSVVVGGLKWIGPTWANIDEQLILRVTPSKTDGTTDARVVIDLKECPMVMEELAHIPPEQRRGPLVVAQNGLPYRYGNWRRAWRSDFDAAGIRAWNRDLRAGGNTEGQDAGARVEDRHKVAGHASAKTTAKVYDRGLLEAHRRVARARAKLRENNP
jgi:hypothetical protein